MLILDVDVECWQLFEVHVDCWIVGMMFLLCVFFKMFMMFHGCRVETHG